MWSGCTSVTASGERRAIMLSTLTRHKAYRRTTPGSADGATPVLPGVRAIRVVPMAAPAAHPGRHPALTRALHWGTALALVAAVGAMFLRDATENDTWRLVLLQVHRQLGLLVLAVVLWRVVRRFTSPLAQHAPDMTVVLRWAATACHIVLYTLLLALPLVGWAMTSAHGIRLALLGLVPLPMLTGADSEWADTLGDYHVWLAWGLLALAGAHAVAALWHHFVRRDPVLLSMLPARRPRPREDQDRLREPGTLIH
jgi:cytochrome b561